MRLDWKHVRLLIAQSAFLALPQEIRDQIYGYLLPSKTSIRVRTQPRQYYAIYNNEFGRLRGTCRQIWHEGSEFIYASNQIKFVEGVGEISQCLANFVPLVGNYVRVVQLRPHFLDMDRGYVRKPHARSYQKTFRRSTGAIGRTCQKEIQQILLLLGSLPRLRRLEIQPYGGDLIDFLEPMESLYAGLVALSGKPTLQQIQIRIRVVRDDRVRHSYPMDSILLTRMLGRVPLPAELPDERGYSTISEFPLLCQ